MSITHRPVVWREKSLSETLGIDFSVPRGLAVTSVEVGATACEPGSLYVPSLNKETIENQRVMIDRAFAHGAVAALTTEKELVGTYGAPIFQVPNLTKALRSLAEVARSRFSGDYIAVTGSVGKTTTKEMMGAVFSVVGPSYINKGNFNGVDSVLAATASLPAEAKFAVVEMSTRRPGVIRSKAGVSKPTVGVVTNVGVSHAEGFSCPGDLMTEKLSLLDTVVDGGVAIVGERVYRADRAGDGLIESKSNIARVVRVGRDDSCDVRLLEERITPTSSVGVVSFFGREVEFMVPASGSHFIENAAYSLAAAAVLGEDLDRLVPVLRGYQPFSRRGVRWSIKTRDGVGLELIEDNYNSAPQSVRALLDTVSMRPKARRRVLVFGDMLELGESSKDLHIGLVADVARAGVDLFVSVGERSFSMAEELKGTMETVSFENSRQAALSIRDLLLDGDLVAVKGSNGMNLGLVVDAISRGGSKVRVNPFWTIEEALHFG